MNNELERRLTTHPKTPALVREEATDVVLSYRSGCRKMPAPF